MQIFGMGFDYAFLPVVQTRGGIIVAWSFAIWSLSRISHCLYSLSTFVLHLVTGAAWALSTVYEPAREEEKDDFLFEIRELSCLWSGPWLIAGDFNMIYWAQDRNNSRLDRRCMCQFRRFLNDAHLKELHLRGRLFMWSNERSSPTLERIDRAFVTNGWEQLYMSRDLHSLASQCSNHASLMLRTDSTVTRHRHFPFQSFWTSYTSFIEVIQWDGTVHMPMPTRSGIWTNSSRTWHAAFRVGATGSPGAYASSWR
jgi:hypothetical protein